MNHRKLFQRMLPFLLVIASLLSMAIAGAAVQTFAGEGKYIMSDFENPDVAKKRAIQRARKDAQKKAGIYLTSFSKSVNAELTVNEISAVTNKIIEVFDMNIQSEPYEVKGEVGIIYTAKLQAKIDPNGIYDFINQNKEEKIAFVEGNERLQAAIQNNDAQVTALKEKYQNATTQAEKNQIANQLKLLDKEFLANEKLATGKKLYYEKNYTEAIKFCSEAIELNPNLSDAYAYRGESYESLKDYERAIKDFIKAVELNPKDEWAYSSLGLIYEHTEKNYEAAIEYFSKSIEINPSAWKYSFRSDVYKKMKDYDHAIADLTRAIELEPNNNHYYFSRALIYHYNLNDYERALADFDKVIQLAPDNELHYRARGDVYKKFEKYDLAIADYTKAIELKADSARAYESRADVYRHNLKDYDRAIADYNKLTELFPDKDEYYLKRASLYTDLKNYDLAIAEYSELIKLHPNEAKYYRDRASIYWKLENYARFIQDMDKIIKLDPNNAENYSNRGVAYARLKDYKQAIKNYDKAIAIDPNYPNAYNNRGFIYMDVFKDYERAIQDFDKALQRKPNFDLAYNNRENARRYLNGRQNVSEYLKRGEEFLKAKDYEKAFEYYEKVLAIDPNNAAAYRGRGKCLQELSKQDLVKANELDKS